MYVREKMLRSTLTPRSLTATIVSLTERKTVNSPTTKSITIKLGCEKSDNENSVCKNLFSKMADRKTKKNNSKISNS